MPYIIILLVVAYLTVKLGLWWVQRPAKKPKAVPPAVSTIPRKDAPAKFSLPSAVGTHELRYSYEFDVLPSGPVVPSAPVSLKAEEQGISLFQNGKQVGFVPDVHKAAMLHDYQERENPVLACLDESGARVKICFYRDYENEKKLRTAFEIPAVPKDSPEESAAFRETLNKLKRVSVTTSTTAPGAQGASFNSARIQPILGHSIGEKLGSFYTIDVETTGLDPEKNEIVQLAAVRFLAFSPVDCFVTYVKPKNGIDPVAAKINGITSETVEAAPFAEALIPAFRTYIGEKIPLVGHNIEFDMQFLCRAGFFPAVQTRQFFDTLQGARAAYKLNSYRLNHLDKAVLHIDRSSAHDALSDALITGYLFRDLVLRKRSST